MDPGKCPLVQHARVEVVIVTTSPFLSMTLAPPGRGCYAATSRQVQLCDVAPRLHALQGICLCLRCFVCGLPSVVNEDLPGFLRWLASTGFSASQLVPPG